MEFDLKLAGVEATESHLRDKQEKYVAAFTNVQNLQELIKAIDEDLISKEEIAELDRQIEEWNELLIPERDKYKQMFVTREQNEAQILNNESAIRLYAENIKFLQDKLNSNK